MSTLPVILIEKQKHGNLSTFVVVAYDKSQH